MSCEILTPFQAPVTIYRPERYDSILPQIEARTLAELQRIYLERKDLAHFPYFYCGTTAKIVLVATGLGLRRGSFVTDDLDSDGQIRKGHTANEDLNGVIYDLTAAQFNSHLLTEIPAGIIVVYPGSELYNRYSLQNPSSSKILPITKILNRIEPYYYKKTGTRKTHLSP